MSTEKKTNAFLYLIIALMLLTMLYAYKKSNDYSKLEDAFKLEQKELANELDELIDDYKDLSVKKKDLSKRLVREMNKIIALKDSVSKLKATNYRLIRKYRRKIVTLERENRDLFAKVDSLNIINTYLKEQNLEVVEQLEVKNTLAKQLEKTNKELSTTKNKLAAKVAIAGELKINNVKAVAMKERSSGKLTTTSRSSRADAFRINFKLEKNEFTTPGEKDIYIQITDSSNKVIAPKGVIELKNKNKIEYSDKLVADYYNEQIEVLSLILVNRDNISKGKYTVNIFVEGKHTGKSVVSLR